LRQNRLTGFVQAFVSPATGVSPHVSAAVADLPDHDTVIAHQVFESIQYYRLDRQL